MQRWTRSPVFSGIWRAQRGENFTFATLARAAQRKFCFCILGAFAKNTKVERHFDTKHNGIAKKSLQKAFFGIFLQKLDPRGPFFSLHKTAHFLIKRCTFFGSGKNFGSEATGQDFRRPPHSNYYSREWEPQSAKPVWGIFVEPIRTEISARPIRDRRPDRTGPDFGTDPTDRANIGFLLCPCVSQTKPPGIFCLPF